MEHFQILEQNISPMGLHGMHSISDKPYARVALIDIVAFLPLQGGSPVLGWLIAGAQLSDVYLLGILVIRTYR